MNMDNQGWKRRNKEKLTWLNLDKQGWRRINKDKQRLKEEAKTNKDIKGQRINKNRQ